MLALSFLLFSHPGASALTGKCIGEIESKNEECGAFDNETECVGHGVSIFSDGVCDWVPAATICGSVRGNVEKRCERCITKKMYTDMGCQFDADDHKCKAPGDVVTDPVGATGDCPLRKFPSTASPPSGGAALDCATVKNNRGCRLAKQCGWNRATEKCVPKEEKPCYQFKYNNLCTGDEAPHCRFNSRTRLCVPKAELPCEEFELKGRCIKNGCMYDKTMTPQCMEPEN